MKRSLCGVAAIALAVATVAPQAQARPFDPMGAAAGARPVVELAAWHGHHGFHHGFHGVHRGFHGFHHRGFYRHGFRGRRFGYRYGHPYYGNPYGYYDDGGWGGAAAAGVIGLAAGAIAGSALAARRGGSVGYCEHRFRSYNPRTGTYLGYDGLRHRCP